MYDKRLLQSLLKGYQSLSARQKRAPFVFYCLHFRIKHILKSLCLKIIILKLNISFFYVLLVLTYCVTTKGYNILFPWNVQSQRTLLLLYAVVTIGAKDEPIFTATFVHVIVNVETDLSARIPIWRTFSWKIVNKIKLMLICRKVDEGSN